MTRTTLFVREQLRAPFTAVLLVTIPAIFIVAAASTLRDFARALGGSLAGDAAVSLASGWSAAFLAGMLGFFAASSARDADRRLALAGLGAPRVAISRIVATIALATIAAASAIVTLELRSGIAHPLHATIAVVAFAWLYLGVGVLIGSVVRDPLEGSLLVVFVFLLDVFSGPGMGSGSAPWAISRTPANVLIASGLGRSSSAADLVSLAITTATSLTIAFVVFALSARRRS
jgi:hypothetical protein